MTRIVCSGFGGQGILTAGLILAKIAMDAGREVTWVPAYGSEMRGGTASCFIKVGTSEIYSPFFKEMDILVAMNQDSLEHNEPLVIPGGTLISNSTIIKDHLYREDIRAVAVDAGAIAEGLDNPRGGNLVMLGAMVQATGLFENDAFADGVDAFFNAKGRNNPQNRECFMAGVAAAS